ncbi:MAG: hypothetical protein PHI86_01845 [Candidatus Omnitrophica bacterium]|nr:hypothetical protein [Candidatus Omnitrophota bacterium]HOX54651.1 hypothetical protein [Candidatus Omnitrophota bacterium]
MKRILLLSVLLLVFLAISVSFYFNNISAQENQPTPEDNAAMVAKLDKILENQTTILSHLDIMKQEIRARCTR